MYTSESISEQEKSKKPILLIILTIVLAVSAFLLLRELRRETKNKQPVIEIEEREEIIDTLTPQKERDLSPEQEKEREAILKSLTP